MILHRDVGFRPVEERDIEAIRRLRNDETTWMYLTDPSQITAAQQGEWFRSISLAKDRRYYTAFIVKREFPIISEEDFLGIVRCDQIDPLNRSIRVGCDIIPEHRRKGYGTQVYGGILKYFFDALGMNRIWLCVLDINPGARDLYKKIGFKAEGRMRQAIWRNGGWHDYIVMSILGEEYRR